jgi:GGDEF domain-containing protein
VNDTYGHLAGDAVLQKLAKIAAGALRQEDIFARYGGEEFAIICRGVKIQHAGSVGAPARQRRVRHLRERRPATRDHDQHRRGGLPHLASRDARAVDRSRQTRRCTSQLRCGRNRVLLKQS